MINVKIIIQNIDYDKTVVGLYPMVIEKCKKTKDAGLLVRFLLKMGYTARKIVRDIIGCISDDTMGELLCSIVWKYDSVILDALTTVLKKNEIGEYIHVGGIAATLGMNGQIMLKVLNVSVNYDGIARSSLARQKIREFADQHAIIFGGVFSRFLEGSAKFVANNFSSQLEKFVINQVEKPENKRKLLDMLSGMLEKNKVCLELAEVTFERSRTVTIQESPVLFDLKPEGQIFSYGLEEKILDTITQYLKRLTEY